MRSVLLVAASAVVAGARSFAAIGQWARQAPQAALTRLDARLLPGLGIRVAPSAATLRRIICLVCPGGLADLTGTDPAGADTLAGDGKAARGSRHQDIPAAHLLAAFTGDGQVLTQARVPDKTNEITCFAGLLRPFDLAGVVVTADALHTQREHARFLVEEKNAHFVFTVKRNHPTLYDRLRMLLWTRIGAVFYDRDTGHDRADCRVIKAVTVDDLEFPHVAQIARIVRHSTRAGKRRRETVYVITDLTTRQASPERLAWLARSQWSIENRLHYVRDVTFGEDTSQVRIGHGPENMATLRSLAINLLRADGYTNIAEGLRHMSYDTFTDPWTSWASPDQPLTSNDNPETTLQWPWRCPGSESRESAPTGYGTPP